jgi:hypothetical protein
MRSQFQQSSTYLDCYGTITFCYTTRSRSTQALCKELQQSGEKKSDPKVRIFLTSCIMPSSDAALNEPPSVQNQNTG